MKIITVFCAGVILAFGVALNLRADIVAGPIKNPANNHRYYLLSPNTWTSSEAEAESLGGTLAVIKNADEQKWVFSTFGTNGGTNNHLWIGLCRQYPGGPFAWVTGAKLKYTYWCNGQPDNGGGVESYVHMCAPNRPFGQPLSGGWNDLADNGSVDGFVPDGVVEIGDEPDKKTLTAKEKSLIGAWYETGKVGLPCWIAGTDDKLFIIRHNGYAIQAALADDGCILQKQWSMAGTIYNGFNGYSASQGFHLPMSLRGEIIKDRILWSDGAWWSRQPVDYKITESETTDHDRTAP